MSLLDLRKIVVQWEDTYKDNGQLVAPPTSKIAIAGVIKNPYAGRYVEDLTPLYDLGAEVSKLLAERGMRILGLEGMQVQSYGKGAIVGTEGEIEHSAALLHPRFGGPVRAAVGGGKDQEGRRTGLGSRYADDQQGQPLGFRRHGLGRDHHTGRAETR